MDIWIYGYIYIYGYGYIYEKRPLKIKIIFWCEVPVLVALNTAGNYLEVLLKIYTDTQISYLQMLKHSLALQSVS